MNSLSTRYVHLQPRPTHFLLQLRRGSRSPEPLQVVAAGKGLRPKFRPLNDVSQKVSFEPVDDA